MAGADNQDEGSASTAQVPTYDVSIWKADVFDHETMEKFVTAALPSSGIVRIGHGLGKVEFKLENTSPDCLPDAKFFLVGFSGAMTNRAAVTAPLFSGIALSRFLKMPLLAFADPVVSASSAVPLGWYAGGQGGICHPRNVACVIDHVSRVIGRIPLIIGGSGGGFAAISVMRYMSMPVRGFVWNPQTRIDQYNPELVRMYTRAAFPKADTALTDQQILVASGVDQDVRSASYAHPSCLVYLQNDSDSHHLADHMKPFISKSGRWHEHDAATRISRERRIIISTGNWGDGHAVPSIAMIQAMAAMLTRDSGQEDPLNFVPGDLPAILKIQPPQEYDVRARAILRGNEVSITIDTEHLPPGLSYAYYLMEDNVRTASQWYSPRATATFHTEIENVARLSTVVFARFEQGNPTPRNIKVESVGQSE